MFKSKMMKSELGITEHVEGDECKFALWTGSQPMSENKIVLKVSEGKTNRHALLGMDKCVVDPKCQLFN